MSTVEQILEVEDIIYHGRGDICRYGRHEPQCPSLIAIGGDVYRCDLYLEHNGWAHSSRDAQAIWGPE